MESSVRISMIVLAIVSALLYQGYKSHLNTTLAENKIRVIPDSMYQGVSCQGGRLVFASQGDLERVTAFLDGGFKSDSEVIDEDKLLDEFEAHFQGFHSLRARIERLEEAGKDKLGEEFPDDVVNALLNTKKEIKIGGSIWIYSTGERFIEVASEDEGTIERFRDGKLTGNDYNKIHYYQDPRPRTSQDPAPQPRINIGNFQRPDLVKTEDDCDANFVVYKLGYNPTTKKYTLKLGNQSTMDVPPVNYLWSAYNLNYSTATEPGPVWSTNTTSNVGPTIELPAGQYDILLELINPSDDEGIEGMPDCDASVQTITLGPCQANFSWQAAGGLSYSFANDSQGDSLTYTWVIKDSKGKVIASLSSLDSYTFPKPDTYEVTLTISNPDGCSDTKTETIKVEGDCKPDFEVTYCDTRTVTFINHSTGGSGNSTFEWDFGDGSAKSKDVSTTHTYAVGVDTYQAILTMKDPVSCPNGKSFPKEVKIEKCNARILVGPVCPDGRVTFEAGDLPSNAKVVDWDFPGATVPFTVKFLNFFGIDPKRPWAYYDNSSPANVYTVTMHYKVKDGCDCKVSRKFEVPKSDCYLRDSRNVKTAQFDASGTTVKMKAVLSQFNRPGFHRIYARTKVRAKLGSKWIKRSDAEVRATFVGSTNRIFKDQGNWLQTYVQHKQCCCFVPESFSGTKSGKKHVKLPYLNSNNFRTKRDEVQSEHWAKVNGVEQTLNLSMHNGICPRP